MICYTHYERMSPFKSIDTSITTHIYPFSFFFLVRTLKFYSLSRFQLYNTVLSIIVTMICIRYVRGTTDWNHLPWPGRIVTSCLSYLTGGLVSNVELTGYHQPEVFRKGQKERGDTSPCVLPTSQNHPFWHPSCLTDALATRKDTNKTWDCEPCGRVVLLGSLTLLLSSLEPLPNKVSWFVSTCISSDSSFPSVRQEPSLRPWKGSPFLQLLLRAYSLITESLYRFISSV